MKIPTILLLLGLFLPITTFAQSDAEGCDGANYFYDLYEDIEKITVQYGSNTGVTGLQEDLFMDIYLPNNQIEERPAIVWAFGGAFVFGSREDMEEACLQFARKGFVTATIDYRLYNPLLGIPDSLAVLDIMVKAMHDMRAAVRHLRLDADTDNLYRIDPDRILVGGASAGAITALQTAFLDSEDNVPAYIQSIIDANGGLEGTSGNGQNLNYSSSAFGVINLSGALLRKEWMNNATQIPIVSMHGMEDEVVPFNHGIATADLNGLIVEFVGMDGSGLIHQEADNLGINNYLVAVPGGGHDDIYFEPAYESFRLDYAVNGQIFVYEQICPQTEIGPEPSSIQELLPTKLELSPNPAGEQTLIKLNDRYIQEIRLFSMDGALVHTRSNLNQPNYDLSLGALPPGLYTLWVQDETGKTYLEQLIKY
ncbi:MAG: alpha/beta hydrolase [Bacteroidota bacterium]